MTFLRFVRGEGNGSWRSAAGTFPDWPDRASDLKLLDPCCGSGHFLVEALRILVPMRMEEEGLSVPDAVDAVLRDNLYGLELDERCTQIAAFNLALAAWTYPGAGGYRLLPELHIACAGVAPGADREVWLRLAAGDDGLRAGLEVLHRLFSDAPLLGSLIDPSKKTSELLTANFERLQPHLTELLAREEVRHDAASSEAAVAAQGLAKAAALLADRYTLVATNVPYLARGKQEDELRNYITETYPEAKDDLATAFLARCLDFCTPAGTAAIVLPQNWMFLPRYRTFRKTLLTNETWHWVARLGEGGFDSSAAAGAFTILLIISRGTGRHDTRGLMCGLDASEPREPAEKAERLRTGEIKRIEQAAQLRNPDARITLEYLEKSTLLSSYATALQGISPADAPRFARCFWELPETGEGWRFWQSTSNETEHFSGKKLLLLYGDDLLSMVEEGKAYLRGTDAIGRSGVAVRQMRNLPATLTVGTIFDTNCSVILPKGDAYLPAIWCFCSSPEFSEAVRRIDQKLNVTNATLVKVPFDLERW